MNARHLSRTLFLVSAAALALAAPRAAAQTPVSPALAVETFDSAWAAIERTHFDTTFGGVDWQALRGELRPRAEAAKTNEALRAVLGDMLGRLKQSHFVVIPGDVQAALDQSASAPAGPTRGDAGLELRLVGERFLVTRVAPGGAADAAGVKPGWSVEAVRGRTAEEVRAWLGRLPATTDPRTVRTYGQAVLARGLSGAAGEAVEARFRDGADRPVTATLTLKPAPGQPTRFGNLPEMQAHAGHERITLEDGTTVGVIRFNIWMPVLSARLDAAVDSLRDADGIVVDLRGNPGGVGGMAAGFAGHFAERRDTLAIMRMRGSTLYLPVIPRARPYTGPVAILTDAQSASTSEFFAGGMQKLGRARVFGETTAGQALPAHLRRLPNDDVLMHAVADFVGPTGERFEGVGVTPDVAAPPTREALLAGRDPALEAAARWISEQRRARPAP